MLAVVLVLVSCLWMFGVQAFAAAEPFDCAAKGPLRFEVTEEIDRPRCDHFDPCRQPFFGTTHLHTGLSFDASIRFVENRPDDAYRFARGKSSITLPNLIGLQGVTFPGLNVPPDLRMPTIDWPTDWGGVTDHSEHFGEMGICKNFLEAPDFPNPPGRFSMDCRMINGFYWQPQVGRPATLVSLSAFQRLLASDAGTLLAVMNNTPVSMMTHLPVCINNSGECDSAELAVWGEHQAAAEENYDRTSACTFTTFNAYENTATPLGTNWHRNVIFRNDRVVRKPVTAIDMGIIPNENPTSGGPAGVGAPPRVFGNIVPPVTEDPDVFPVPHEFVSFPLPERFWNKLERECTHGENITDGKAGRCDWLSIPHNPNLGGGSPPLVPPLFFDPFNDEDARRRQRFEPLVEIYQDKGSSECRWDPRFKEQVGLTQGDKMDEFCNFELLDSTSLSGASGFGGGAGQAVPPSAFDDRAFVRNIWKDGLMLADETFNGINPFKMGVVASSDSHTGVMGWHPENERWPGHEGIEDAIPVQEPNNIQNSSGGHSVVWAEENSRDSIFEALKRKETYGTSGTRITLRFFGGWNFDDNLCGTNFVRTGYAEGVPMGGDLPPPSPGDAPRFVVAAWMDDFIGTPLEQIQIIKGWTDASGNTHEKVVRVKGKKGKPKKPQKGVTKSCEPKGNGFESLCAVWEDPDFNTNERAFYYARAIERPVCRYSTLWCQKAFGLNPLKPNQCRKDLAKLQEGSEQDRTNAGLAASCCSNEKTAPIVQTAIQERAWSSPIWYTPEG